MTAERPDLTEYGFTPDEIRKMRDDILWSFQKLAENSIARGSKKVMLNPSDVLTVAAYTRTLEADLAQAKRDGANEAVRIIMMTTNTGNYAEWVNRWSTKITEAFPVVGVS